MADPGEDPLKPGRQHPEGVHATPVAAPARLLADPREVAHGSVQQGLRVGDIVFFDDPMRAWPYKVYRIGYDFFEGMVRVARLAEDTTIYENGSWVSASCCLKLEISDWLEVRSGGVEAASVGHPKLAPGTRCRFLGFDADGDVLLRVGPRRTTIFFEDLDKVTTVYV